MHHTLRNDGSVRHWMLGVVGILLFVLLSTSARAADVTHLTYGAHGEAWFAFLAGMAEKFEAQTGLQVDVIVNTGNYQEQVAVQIAGGVGPDVTDFHPQLGASLIQQGVFENLRPYMHRDGFDLSEFPPVAIEGMTAPDGSQWGLPISVFPVVTYYNATMFEAAGLADPGQLGDDWSWDTLLSSARQLTIDRNGDGVIDQYGVERRITARWEQQVHQAGGQWFDRLVFPTESRFNTPQVLEAVRFLHRLLVDEQVATPSTNVNEWSVWSEGPANVAVTTVDGPGVIPIRWQNAHFDWDVAMQPKGPANRAARVNPDGFQIIADSPNKEAAWEWLKFLLEVENQVEFAMITARLPAHRDAMVRYNESDFDLPPSWRQVFLATASDPNGYAAYVIPDGAVQTAINQRIGQVWNGQVPPETALVQIHDQVNALLRGEN